jgi:hypothetical protein
VGGKIEMAVNYGWLDKKDVKITVNNNENTL